MTVTMRFASAVDYTNFVREIGTAVKNLLRDKTQEQQDDAWNAISGAARSFASTDGSILLPAEVICIVGRR